MNTSHSTTKQPHVMQVPLTGGWQVHPLALDSQDVLAESSDGRQIPDSVHLQPVLYPDNPYWGERLRALNHQAWIYRRTFAVPNAAFKRARLRFEGVDYFASVWVNGQFAGEHEGHFAPFTLDVTRFLRPNAENMLTVRVTSPWDAPNPKGNYPIDHVIRGLVKGHYEHGEGVIPPDVNPLGIWRPVWLVLDEGISLDHLRIRTALDGRVAIQVTATNATPNGWEGTLGLRVVAENHTGGRVTLSEPLRLAPGTQQAGFTLHIPDVHLWWPWDHGSPNLYRLEATLHDGEKVTSERTEVFGVRTVRLERSPERFTYWINDRPVFLRGSSYMPGLYLAQCSRDLLAKDVQLAREAHLNLMRVHVHVSPPELYDLCDRAGMLVWQDFELNWVHDTSPEFERRARLIQRDMIDLLGNHPSIITWTCHNEPTMLFTRRQNYERRPDPALYTDAVAQDPTRPVFICSGQMESDWQRAGDVHSYYGAIWSRRYTDIYSHSFRLNTEFGFEAPAALSTLQAYPDTWERLHHLEGKLDELWAYQAALIQYQVEHLRRLRATCAAGYIHFWLNDVAPQIGCGVLDVNRLPKGGYDALRRASQPLHIALEHDGKRATALWVFNDTPQAYSSSRVRWRVLDAAGNVISENEFGCDIAANASHPVHDAVPMPVQPARVELGLCTSDGTLLAENYYLRPFQPLLRPRGYPWKFDRYLGTKTFDRPGTPSLADDGVNPIFKLVPLSVREAFAEWALRQQLPLWLISVLSRLVDRVMT